jgi:hypothetical protein
VLVGDLNLNPFDHGVVSTAGLNGTMTKRIAGRGNRVVQGSSYQFFYNPMWNCFGDASGQPPGTYYYERGDHVSYFWHMFDQVLVRPDLMGSFSHDHLRILHTDGQVSLVTPAGSPDSKKASDHLPLVFRLDL